MAMIKIINLVGYTQFLSNVACQIERKNGKLWWYKLSGLKYVPFRPLQEDEYEKIRTKIITDSFAEMKLKWHMEHTKDSVEEDYLHDLKNRGETFKKLQQEMASSPAALARLNAVVEMLGGNINQGKSLKIIIDENNMAYRGNQQTISVLDKIKALQLQYFNKTHCAANIVYLNIFMYESLKTELRSDTKFFQIYTGNAGTGKVDTVYGMKIMVDDSIEICVSKSYERRTF